jgi:hypothetical protein
MDFSLKKNNVFFTFGRKIVVVTIYENVGVFFNSNKMDGSKIFCKKSWKNGFETNEMIRRRRAKFYRNVTFCMADTVV